MKLSDQAYEALKADIIGCVLEPGQQITQSQLSEAYNFGVVPLREALQRLAQEGFVEPIPRFGYVVRPITISGVYEICELRAILESSAARLAAERASDEQLSEIARLADLTYVHGNLESYSQFVAGNAEFHRLIALAADNQKLADCLSRVMDEMMQILNVAINLRDSADQTREEHITLAKALLDRDGAKAEAIVRRQVKRAQDEVLEALTRRRGAGLAGASIQVN